MPSNDRYPIEEQENWINILRRVKNSCTSRLVFLSCFCSPCFQHTPLPKSHTRQIFSHSSYFQRNLKIVLRTAWKVKRYHSGMKRESEQMATASADKAAGSKFPPKWDNGHARRLHPLILFPRASVSFGDAKLMMSSTGDTNASSPPLWSQHLRQSMISQALKVSYAIVYLHWLSVRNLVHLYSFNNVFSQTSYSFFFSPQTPANFLTKLEEILDQFCVLPLRWCKH